MPITLSGIDTGVAQSGIGSYLVLADRAAVGTAGDRTDVDNFHNIRYEVQTAEIAGNAPGIEIPVVSRTPSAFPVQAGPLDIINGFTIPAYSSQLEPIYRNLLNDSRELDTSATGPPTLTQVGGRIAAQTGLASGVAVTDTASAPSGLTQPNFPMRLTFTQTAAVSGTLTISGTDGNGDPLVETITYPGSTATVQTTDKFFASIATLRASATMTVAIGQGGDATDRVFQSEFRGRTDSRLLYGVDAYVRKGEVPNTYREVFIDSLSFTFSRDGAVAYTINCIGKRPFEAKWIDGITTTESTGTGGSAEGFFRETAGVPQFPYVTREAFTGWQGGLFYRAPGASADSRLPVINGTVTISNNLGFSPTVTGRRRPGSTFRNRRAVTLEGTLEYKIEDSALIDDVLSGEFLENTYVRLQNAAGGSFPSQAQFNFGRLQFSNVPSAPIAGEDFIQRQMTLQSSDSADGTRPDITIRTQVQNPLPLAEITF